MDTEKVIETVKAAMKALLDTTPKEWDESICDYVFTDKEEIERILEANKITCEALGKQIPKKPNSIFCPVCNFPSIIDGVYGDRYPYCNNCGQAIDWEDNE